MDVGVVVSALMDMSSMHYHSLGRSDLRVADLNLGAMTIGGRGVFAKFDDTDRAGARRLVDRCIEAGIILIDTADVYPLGRRGKRGQYPTQSTSELPSVRDHRTVTP